MIKVIMVLIVTSGNHVTLVNGGVFDDEGACRRAMVASASMLSDDALHATQAICVGADVPEASK